MNIQFQYLKPGSERCSDMYITDVEFEESKEIPSKGDYVHLMTVKKDLKTFEVVARHFYYYGDGNKIGPSSGIVIIVTDAPNLPEASIKE